ncbi:MAG: hypothetical protein ABI763_06535 [Bacteroidota bacterium]
MKKKITLLAAFAMSVCILSAQQPAIMVSPAAGWHKIATTTADFKKERDEVSVLGADQFSAIRFKVTDAPLDLQDLEIWFENGTKQDVQVRTPLQVGMESRIINIQGGAQDIDKIVFVYKTLPNRKDDKAEVEIYGLKPGENGTAMNDMDRNKMNNMDHSQAPKNVERDKNFSKNENQEATGGMATPKVEMNDKTGWHRIGETTVSFAKEKDVISVMGADRYAKIKFKVMDAGIIIDDLTISFEDGTSKDVALKSTFAEGQESRVIDVPGAEKDIARIAFVYHSIPNQAKDKAHVEIWGFKTNAEQKKEMKK